MKINSILNIERNSSIEHLHVVNAFAAMIAQGPIRMDRLMLHRK